MRHRGRIRLIREIGVVFGIGIISWSRVEIVDIIDLVTSVLEKRTLNLAIHS